MLNINRDNIVWAFVCPHTGIVFDEKWASTEPCAISDTQRWLGKRRFQNGEMKAIRVRLEILSDEETQKVREEFEVFRARKRAAE